MEPVVRSGVRTSRFEQVIGKINAMPDKTVFTCRYVFTDKCMGLDAGSVTNNTSFLYLNKGANENIIA